MAFVGAQRALLSGNVFSPRVLFLQGQQGAWYDPSDLSTLFQDTAGTTPVTAAGQAVALMLDKSKGLTLGANVAPAFVSAGTGWTVINTDATHFVTFSNGSARFYVSSSTPITTLTATLTANKYYLLTFTTTEWISGQLKFDATGTSITIPAGVGTYQVKFYSTSGTFSLYRAAGGVTDLTFSNILIQEVLGNHATQATLGQRPICQVDSSGRPYLAFDGLDDGMVTSSIDFTGTDKMTVWAGVRKLSDAAAGTVAELSATIASNNGSFRVTAPNSAAANYGFSSKGTSQSDAVATTYTAPTTDVVTGIGDISGDIATLRVDGAQKATSATDQGTGTYGNYPLYIGRRGGASVPLNGRLYSLIVRGDATPDGIIQQTERWVNGKTGAY